MQNKVFNGFIAALLHDIGKMILDHNGDWGPHEKVDVTRNQYLKSDNIDFSIRLREIFPLIKQHGKLPKIKATSLEKAKDQLNEYLQKGEVSLVEIALILGDRLQKGMHGISKEKDSALDRAKNFPHFFPYFEKDKRWDEKQSAEVIKIIYEKLSNLDLRMAISIQEHCRKFPHTTYIPHISLDLHHRFSAVLYYFLYEGLRAGENPLDLQKLYFSVMQITPDPPNLLYRMKDIRVIKDAIERMREYLFATIFEKHNCDLLEITKDVNPFEFFAGDSMVVIYADVDILIKYLQGFVDRDPQINTLHLKIRKYQLTLEWSLNRNGELSFFSEPGGISVIESQISLISKTLQNYSLITMESCNKCNKPVTEVLMDIKGDILCPQCKDARRSITGGINIEEVVGKIDEGIAKIGFISITVPEDITGIAVSVAEKELISFFKDKKGINKNVAIPATKTGLFEYLQAISAIQLFQSVLEKEIETKNTAHTLYLSPNCAIYLLREDSYWHFLWSMLEVKKDLHIPSSIKGVICDPHYPFWSLIDTLMSYTKEDLYYYTSERSVIMFKDVEVMSIRSLSDTVRKEGVPQNQLQILIQTAIRSSLEELRLEIDVRERDRKLGRGAFASRLKQELEKLKGEDYKDREKRSIFIKYIAKLSK